MIKKALQLFCMLSLCFVSCNPGDDSSSTMDENMNNDPIIVEQLSTNQGFVNDIVSIEGSNFLSQESNLSVLVASTIADIVNVTYDRIEFRVPSGLQETTHLVTLMIAEQSYELGLFNILSDVKLLAASSNGKIYELGAFSGNTTIVGSTTYDFLSAFTPVNVLKHENSVFFFDTYSPGASTLVKHNLFNNTSEFQELMFPPEIVGNEPGIIAFEYDTSNDLIVAVINENVISQSEDLNYVITINPDNYQVTYTGITFNQISINSTLLKNNTLYVSTTEDSYEMRAVNLNTGLSEIIELSSDYKISQLADFGNSIYAIRSGISVLGAVTPLIIDPNTFEVTLFMQDNDQNYTLSSFFGNSYIDNDVVYSVITSNTYTVGVLQFNTATNTYHTQGLNSNSVASNLKILDVIN